ncbi:thioredoxin [Christensenella timonensis]|uniref:thioredoxin n=1 Tax=Christensenella timonensis TaxID=1816678 RepID=UPI000835AF7B|nr:thioredoxin [Christensenella timonensis]
MSIKHITEGQFDSEVLQDKNMVLVDFYADWCGPCKMLTPILEEIDGEIPNLKIVKVNVDEAQNLAKEYGVMSIPTVYLFDGGAKMGRFVGVKSKEEIVDFVENA